MWSGDGQGKAIVKKDGVQAWVGTRLAPVENPMWQVRLKQGEVLEVYSEVDRERLQLSEQQPTWLQIAPPNGEFRWIHQDNIKLLNPPSSPTSAPATSAPSEGAVPMDWSLDIEPTESETDSVTVNQGWQPATKRIESVAGQRSEFVSHEAMLSAPPESSPAANASLPASSSSGTRDEWDRSITIPARLMSNSSGNLGQASGSLRGSSTTPTSGQPAAWNQATPVQQLEQQLTLEMLKQPAEWNLQAIAAQAQQLRSTTQDAMLAQQIDNLLQKIESCLEIQAGYRAAQGAPNSSILPGASALPTTQDTISAQAIRLVGGEAELSGQYDAVGWLNELVRDSGMQKSTYVLQDENGKITHHVAAPPGLNLRRYLHQKVRIVGNRGFHQELKLDHVMAERVITIDSLR